MTAWSRALLALLIAAGGAAVLGLLMLMPITFGEHGEQSCGNALVTHLDRWENNAEGDFRDRAERACNRGRVSRVVAAVPVTLATIGGVVILSRRRGGSA